MVAVSATFPKVTGSQRGYDVQQVEDFLREARSAYSNDSASSSEGAGAKSVRADTIGAESIRHTAFTMVKGGYSPQHVDTALERLEDAFATRERDRVLRETGDETWFSEARALAEAIVTRLERPEKHRFDRVTVLSVGYHPKDVDRMVTRLKGYFSDGRPLSIEDVRTSVFRPKRGGYREGQVDLVLDSVVDVMLAVR
ncbi:MAG: transporter permease [Frondihabitans sp.]|nr:transporter permease [Frondihabitans sp.]